MKLLKGRSDLTFKDSYDGCWIRLSITMYLSDRRVQLVTPSSRIPVKAVSKESVPNKMSEFLRFSTDTDRVLAILNGDLLRCKIYQANGTEIARESKCLITSLTKGQALSKEIVEFDYPYDVTWPQNCLDITEALRNKFRIVLPSHMPWLIFDPGTSLVFNILSKSTIPATPHINTEFNYHVYLFNGDYSKYMKLKRTQYLPGPGFVGVTHRDYHTGKGSSIKDRFI
ncbi:hypothetical protein ES703_19876 [subsurface metagenome]